MSRAEGVVWKRKLGRETEAAFLRNKTDDNMKSEIKNLSKKKRSVLVSFRDLPEYMKDNEFILNYYRTNLPLKEALFSVFRWHNETLNVWTHLIGFALFLGLTLANLMQLPQLRSLFHIFFWSFPLGPATNVSHNSRDLFLGLHEEIELKPITPLILDTTPPEMETTRWPFFIFLGGSMFCLLTSSICHLFCCHSQHLNILLLQMDYVGITVMIITSFFPPIHYIFQCDPLWQFVYLGGITTMGVFTIITLLSPTLSTSKYRRYRAFIFMSMGLFGIVPTIHALTVNWSEPQSLVTLAYEAAMALSYITGTVFYVSRIPERWKPGWFDLAGHSHQIFHVFVILGALAHYSATLVFMQWRNLVRCETILDPLA